MKKRKHKVCSCTADGKSDEKNEKKRAQKTAEGGARNIRLPLKGRLDTSEISKHTPPGSINIVPGTPLLDGSGDGVVRGWILGSMLRKRRKPTAQMTVTWQRKRVRINYGQIKQMPPPSGAAIKCMLDSLAPFTNKKKHRTIAGGTRACLKNLLTASRHQSQIPYVYAQIAYVQQADLNGTVKNVQTLVRILSGRQKLTAPKDRIKKAAEQQFRKDNEIEAASGWIPVMCARAVQAIETEARWEKEKCLEKECHRLRANFNKKFRVNPRTGRVGPKSRLVEYMISTPTNKRV